MAGGGWRQEAGARRQKLWERGQEARREGMRKGHEAKERKQEGRRQEGIRKEGGQRQEAPVAAVSSSGLGRSSCPCRWSNRSFCPEGPCPSPKPSEFSWSREANKIKDKEDDELENKKN